MPSPARPHSSPEGRAPAATPLRVAVLPHPQRRAARLQLEPLRRASRQLRRHGLHVTFGTPAADVDVVAVQFDWDAPLDEVTGRLDLLRRSRPDARLVLLDYYDSSSSTHAAAVAHCDAFLRSQYPADLDDLAAAPGTGGPFGRRVAEVVGKDVPDGRDRQAAEVVREHAHKFVLGWNYGAADFIHNRLFRGPAFLRRPRPVAAWSRRSIDLHCVSGIGVPAWDDWYHRHRAAALAAAASLSGRLRVLHHGVVSGEGNAMSPRQYRRSLGASKICLSPLGYGELCYRDFEAVAAGCLLVKPEMVGLRTAPDLFEPGVTYLPCRWDFGDLADVVNAALEDPEGSGRIARAARRRLLDFHLDRGWIRRFETLVRRAVSPEPQVL